MRRNAGTRYTASATTSRRSKWKGTSRLTSAFDDAPVVVIAAVFFFFLPMFDVLVGRTSETMRGWWDRSTLVGGGWRIAGMLAARAAAGSG
ncbi:hypothetical protein [Sphingomonas yabuuchiae]|uniref:Uncharacterized protein n=1 Tax=Sphingomonas yabuuchiae TaxID=172044 RepID=A0AA41DEU1_9SPHN|nr:hypothetical protein [Sphingomonas yabuuchiae]MBB4610765.1 hypothetical protein [Sphingomonas yabuuchiae]MBN3557680.1 hypothetical protein [Sphingomonas yabuuchiae]